jgi:C-terminal processing protease CtpA/Prc
MINGTKVDNLLVGGPAYNSKEMTQGDVILKVDSVDVTEENIRDLLVGNDTPGTPMQIVVGKGGSEVHMLNVHQILLEYSFAFCNGKKGREPLKYAEAQCTCRDLASH